MRKSLIVFLCVLSSAAFAQEGSRRGLFFRPDTTFAVRHPYRFTIRPNVGITFGMFTSQWTTEEGPHDYSLMSSPVFKAGCSVSYLGLMAGIHRDVRELFGETEDSRTLVHSSTFPNIQIVFANVRICLG